MSEIIIVNDAPISTNRKGTFNLIKSQLVFWKFSGDLGSLNSYS